MPIQQIKIMYVKIILFPMLCKSKQPRPIVAKFHYYHDREKNRTAANANREDLKQTNHGVGVQLPKEWREARKSLYPIMQREKASGKKHEVSW